MFREVCIRLYLIRGRRFIPRLPLPLLEIAMELGRGVILTADYYGFLLLGNRFPQPSFLPWKRPYQDQNRFFLKFLKFFTFWQLKDDVIRVCSLGVRLEMVSSYDQTSFTRRQGERSDGERLTLLAGSGGDLWQVSEVVSFHLEVEHLALRLSCIGDEEFIQQVLKRATKHTFTVIIYDTFIQRKHLYSSVHMYLYCNC